ncbi:hypothetical protein BDV93DRAFT_523001 [Ceratobasidium sp. AG-I]|nr:hypothetical protein BDV93DRAFT_523001 [Ceratobasidium sp. AG-I]
MVHPALEDCHWQKRVDNNGGVTYVRPMVAGEVKLDQVHRLFDGHNHFVFGVTFKSTLPRDELNSRLLNALVQLRYASPIVGAQAQAGIHDPELRSWVYTPLTSLAEAQNWARSAIQSTSTEKDSTPESRLCEIVSQPLPDNLQLKLYLHGPYTNGEYTLFPYSSHAVLEGQAMLDLLRTLFNWMVNPSPEDELTWGEEWRNLAPGTVVALGGELEGWDVESPALLEENAKVLLIKKPSHCLRPQRKSVTTPGKIVRVHRELDEPLTTRLIKAAKSQGVSITQVLEAAHVIATYIIEPLPLEEAVESHVRLYPALVSTRHLRQPPHNKPESMGNLNTAFGNVFPGSLHVEQPTIRERVLAVARCSKEQYRKFMSNPHYPFILAAENKLNPFRGPLGADPNPHAGEAIGMGVIDPKLGVKWSSPGGEDVIQAQDVHLGLRQCTMRPIMHTWTFGGKLRLQVQASDIWDAAYLKQYLDEVVKCALSICDSA